MWFSVTWVSLYVVHIVFFKNSVLVVITASLLLLVKLTSDVAVGCIRV